MYVHVCAKLSWRRDERKNMELYKDVRGVVATIAGTS